VKAWVFLSPRSRRFIAPLRLQAQALSIDTPLEGAVWSELVSDAKICLPSMWNIVFYNDDYTPMDFVEFVLKTVFHMSALVQRRIQ
jgi:hypothetical protein